MTLNEGERLKSVLDSEVYEELSDEKKSMLHDALIQNAHEGRARQKRREMLHHRDLLLKNAYDTAIESPSSTERWLATICLLLL